MIRRPPRSTLDRSSAASDVYKRQAIDTLFMDPLTQGVTNVFLNHVDYINKAAVRMPLTAARTIDLRAQMLDAKKTIDEAALDPYEFCLLYTSPSPRDRTRSRMPSSA